MVKGTLRSARGARSSDSGEPRFVRRARWRGAQRAFGLGILVGALAAGIPKAAAAALDPHNEIFLRWNTGADPRAAEAKNVDLLRKAGVTAVLLPWPATSATEPFARACRSAGMRIIAEMGPAGSLAEARQAAAQARQAGFEGLALETGDALDSEKSVRDFAAEHAGLSVLIFLTPDQIAWNVAPAYTVLTAGLWPGVRSGPNQPGRGIEVATASTEPWVDANSYLVAYLRAMHPDRPALLGYRPDENAGLTGGRAVAFETLEIGLIEAFVAGGNFVMPVEDDYRDALLAGDPKALAAWDSLGRTVQFLRQHAESLRQPTRARVALASGNLAESGEVLNLMYRRNLCPVVMPVDSLPAIDSARFRALVAVNIEPPGEQQARRMLDFAGAGGLLVTAPAGRSTPAWWLPPEAQKTRSDKDRDHYSFGKGRIVAYHDPILDPSEFALDVIDLVGVKTRDLRLWKAGSVVGIAAGDLGASKAFMYLINYGDPIDQEFPARVEGVFRKATMYEPGGEPRDLPAAKRGPSTEVAVGRLGRFALIELTR